MAHARWTQDEGWGQRGIIAYQDLTLSPAAAVLHYGQEIFEGIKAYRHQDGSVWTFRPRYNAARLNASARRMALPEMEEEDIIASLVDLLRADHEWVPGGAGESLYLRPFAFASEPFLGVRPARQVDYYVIASPAGNYFPHGLEPLSIWVSREYHRAGPGGTGAAKTGGNYASSLLPQQEAYEAGCDQVCFLDAATEQNLEELGGMNIMVVDADGSVRTPRLTGSILEGSTRASIITLLRDEGRRVTEETISLQGPPGPAGGHRLRTSLRGLRLRDRRRRRAHRPPGRAWHGGGDRRHRGHPQDPRPAHRDPVRAPRRSPRVDVPARLRPGPCPPLLVRGCESRVIIV